MGSDGIVRTAALAPLLGLLLVTAQGLSCLGPYGRGAAALLDAGDGRLGVLLVEDEVELDDAGRPGIVYGEASVVWTTDGDTWTTPEPVPGDDLSGLPVVSVDRCLDPWGCVDPDASWTAVTAAGDPTPVALTRTRLLTRGAGTCGGPAPGIRGEWTLPDGRTVLAMGVDGVAIEDGDGWERTGVGGIAPRPTTLREGVTVLRWLPADAVPGLLAAGVATWFVALVLRVRARRDDPAAGWPVALLLAPVAACGVALPVLGMAFLAGVGEGGALLLGGAVAAVLLSAGLRGWRRVPGTDAGAIGRLVRAAVLAPVVVTALWLVGAPGPWWTLWAPLSAVAALGVVLVGLVRETGVRAPTT